jgi:hypothetical protein
VSMIKCFNGTTSALDTVMKPTNAYTHLIVSNIILVGWCTVVSIATGYGLDGLGDQILVEARYSNLSRPAPGHTQPPVQWVPSLSWG